MVYQPDHPHARENGYVYEHILVAENKLGRFLTDNEVVHHIDENKLNNSPDNLMVFSSPSEHMKYHWETRNHKYKTADGQLRTIEELAQLGGINYMTAYQRIKKLGWSPDETISGTRRKRKHI